jgi:hypothetical protein
MRGMLVPIRGSGSGRLKGKKHCCCCVCKVKAGYSFCMIYLCFVFLSLGMGIIGLSIPNSLRPLQNSSNELSRYNLPSSPMNATCIYTTP